MLVVRYVRYSGSLPPLPASPDWLLTT
jgi:hypothetical protein